MSQKPHFLSTKEEERKKSIQFLKGTTRDLPNRILELRELEKH